MFKQKSDPAASSLAPADAVQQARTRARQRLIGAIVLLGIGIIGFPLVFETQPRPIPVDIPIEIPKKDALSPLSPPSAPATGRAAVTPALPPQGAAVTESRSDAGHESTATEKRPDRAPATVAVSASAASAARVATAASVEASRTPMAAPSSPAPANATAAVVSKRVDAAASADAAKAQALLEARPVASAETGRFVVQVGAFADVASARDTRLKVEKLGLKTYTQIAQTPGGSRIRVRIGPFTSRIDADAALAKARAAGLAAVVMTL
ncbi:MAG: SPOR domain-containing protein [Pseudomonadota bacterium]|nr:SPOR domain-containing protein [Pseudomonadota bacterium]